MNGCVRRFLNFYWLLNEGLGSRILVLDFYWLREWRTRVDVFFLAIFISRTYIFFPLHAVRPYFFHLTFLRFLLVAGTKERDVRGFILIFIGGRVIGSSLSLIFIGW